MANSTLNTHVSFEKFTQYDKAVADMHKELAKFARYGEPVFSYCVTEITFEKALHVADWQVENTYDGKTMYTSTETRYQWEITIPADAE